MNGHIGWLKPDDPCFKPLSADVTLSNSGVVFNDFHSLLTFANIKASAENFDAFGFPDYDTGTTYSTGERVKFKVGKFVCTFRSRVDSNLNNQPDASPTEWESFDLLSEWYRRITNQATQQFFNSVALKKKLDHKTKSIIQDQKLYDGTGRITETIANDGCFVGFEIVLERAENLLLLIQQVGVHLNAIQPDLNIYLFHSSKSDPITIFPYTNAITANSFDWQATPFELPYVLEDLTINSTTQDAGGRFYLGYYQDDLVGEAINKNFNFGNCGGCGAWNIQTLRTVRSFLSVRSIKVRSFDLPMTRILWDIGETSYAGDRTWGINFKLTINCDWTQFLCSNKSRFENAIGRAVAVRVLQEIAFNTRSSDLSEDVKKLALFAIEGDDNVDGMAKKLEKEVDAMNFDLSDFGSPCAPCESRKGVRRKTA